MPPTFVNVATKVLALPVDPGALLWSVDFTDPFFAGMGAYDLGFARASTATAQWNAITVIDPYGNDVPRFGGDGTRYGFIIEESRTNIVETARNLTGVGWNATAGVTPNFAAGPDGLLTASLSTALSGGFGAYWQQVKAAGNYCFSLWQKQSAAAPSSLDQSSDGVNAANSAALGGVNPAQWTRRVFPFLVNGGALNVTLVPVDGRDWSGIGGIPAANRSQLIDLVQIEVGKFATEAIITSGASQTRAGERLYKATGDSLVDGGRLSLEFSLWPKAASSGYGTNAVLWSKDAPNASFFLAGTMAVRTFFGGVNYDTPVAASWNAGDRVDVWIAIGGNLPCDVQYRKNGGAAIKLSTGVPTTFGNLVVGGNLDLLNQATAAQLSCWCRGISAYRKGYKPSWVI